MEVDSSSAFSSSSSPVQTNPLLSQNGEEEEEVQQEGQEERKDAVRTGGEERGRGHEHERPSDRGNSAGSRNLFVKNKDPREDLQEESSLPASSSSSSFFCAEASLSPPKAACSRPSFSSADSPHERKDERRKDEGEGELKSPREEEFSRILNTSFSSSPSPSAAWGKEISKPKKSSYRQRAHCNPLADSYIIYPRNPDYVDWSLHFPSFFPASSSSRGREAERDRERKEEEEERLFPHRGRSLYLNTDQNPVSYPHSQPASLNGSAGPHRVEFLDVGCGYGGLLVSLAPRFPKTLMLGMEIREKVTNYVGERIDALRREHQATGQYNNISIIRTNVAKFLVNYMRRAQLSKMFFCFPDPHFKRSNWRRRIINKAALSLYAYVLRPGAILYTVTDVEELHKWIRQSCLLHPLFEEISLDSPELSNDICIHAIENDTEEGMKVKRMGQPCFTCVFRRL